MKKTFKAQNTAISTGQSRSAKMVADILNEMDVFATVLDYGCGTGRNIEYLVKNISTDNTIVGVDTKEQEERSNRKWSDIMAENKNTALINLGMLEILRGNCFDVILNSHVLNVIDDLEVREMIVKNIYKLLISNGKAVFEVRADVEKNATEKNWETYGDGYVTPTNTFQKQFSKEELEKLLVDAGFKIEQHICNKSHHIVVASK